MGGGQNGGSRGGVGFLRLQLKFKSPKTGNRKFPNVASALCTSPDTPGLPPPHPCCSLSLSLWLPNSNDQAGEKRSLSPLFVLAVAVGVEVGGWGVEVGGWGVGGQHAS